MDHTELSFHFKGVVLPLSRSFCILLPTTHPYSRWNLKYYSWATTIQASCWHWTKMFHKHFKPYKTEQKWPLRKLAKSSRASVRICCNYTVHWLHELITSFIVLSSYLCVSSQFCGGFHLRFWSEISLHSSFNSCTDLYGC